MFERVFHWFVCVCVSVCVCVLWPSPLLGPFSTFFFPCMVRSRFDSSTEQQIHLKARKPRESLNSSDMLKPS